MSSKKSSIRVRKMVIEAINGRLIVSPDNHDEDEAVIVIKDIENIEHQKYGRMGRTKVTILTRDNKIYSIDHITAKKGREIIDRIAQHLDNYYYIDDDTNNVDSLSVKIGTTKIQREKDKIWSFNIKIIIISTIASIVGTMIGGWWSIMTIIPAIGALLRKTLINKDIDIVKKIKDYKNNQVRLIISSVLLVIGCSIFFFNIAERSPYIEIIGGEIQNIGSDTGFLLEIKSKRAHSILIDGIGVTLSSSGSYNQQYDMMFKTNLNIKINATNRRERIEKQITITRQLTTGETNQLEIEVKEKIDQENALKEKQRKEREERDKSPAGQLAKEIKEIEEKRNKQVQRLEGEIEENQLELRWDCQASIKGQLLSPDTADFPFGGYNIRPYEENIVIKSYVDYKNGYGSQIRSYFRCEFSKSGSRRKIIKANFEI